MEIENGIRTCSNATSLETLSSIDDKIKQTKIVQSIKKKHNISAKQSSNLVYCNVY